MSRRAAARAFSTTPRTALATPSIAQLPRAVLQVSGPDAQKFLKGQMCKDVDALGGGYSGFLNASGRVLHTVFCIPTRPNSYLIAYEEAHPVPLDKLLPPFRLRAKVKLQDVSAEWDVYSAWGSDAAPAPNQVWRFGNGGAAERIWSWDGERTSLGVAESEVATWDLRAGWGPSGMGKVVLVPKGQRRELEYREQPPDPSVSAELV